MTRGRQKLEAQAKNANKSKDKGSQLDARAAALKTHCPVCKCPLTNEKALKEHFEARHPGKDVPKT